MWKFVARGIRESLGRSGCRTNICSQSSQDTNSGNSKGEIKTSLVCNQKFLPPSFSAFTNGFYGFTKANSANDKKQSKWDAKHDWTEAVGWSSVLAIGWVVSQSLCLRRRIFEKDQRQETNFHRRVLQIPEVHIKHLLAQVLNLKPQFVLPTAYCIGNDNEKIDVATETDWIPSKPYGPLTAEETLKEAENKFLNTHRIAVGEYELRLGILAVKDKRYNDALKNFAAGAKLSSPGSLFNLGLCHELGLGTNVDVIKAGRYYKKAAEMGHADAMYNLAVFYAQGRGDISVDFDRARILFRRAADLGQEEAKRALDCEAELQVEHISNEAYSILSKKKSSTFKKARNAIKISLNQLLKYEDYFVSKPNEKSDSLYFEEKLDEATDPTEVFLNMLGINEKSVVNTIANG